MRQQTLTMQDAINTAKMLSEALPYLQRYSGAVVVVKFGGNAMGDEAAMAEFAVRVYGIVAGLTVSPWACHSPATASAKARVGRTSGTFSGVRKGLASRWTAKPPSTGTAEAVVQNRRAAHPLI